MSPTALFTLLIVETDSALSSALDNSTKQSKFMEFIKEFDCLHRTDRDAIARAISIMSICLYHEFHICRLIIAFLVISQVSS